MAPILSITLSDPEGHALQLFNTYENKHILLLSKVYLYVNCKRIVAILAYIKTCYYAPFFGTELSSIAIRLSVCLSNAPSSKTVHFCNDYYIEQ